ncbi:MAG: 50S ribosomal protein L24e [Candidatus Aenigmarchaeota archaeon]
MKCSICKSNILKGSGKMFVKNDGKIFYFCGSKCQRNWGMGREPKKLKWAVSEKKVKKS